MCSSNIVQIESENVDAILVVGQTMLQLGDVSGGQPRLIISNSPTHSVVVVTAKVQTVVKTGSIEHPSLEVMLNCSS